MDDAVAPLVLAIVRPSAQALVHEVIVVLPPANGATLTYDDREGRVIENRIKDLGEVSDL